MCFATAHSFSLAKEVITRSATTAQPDVAQQKRTALVESKLWVQVLNTHCECTSWMQVLKASFECKVITEAAEAGEPLLFFCKIGKDRTGVLAALLLSCCGAKPEEIIADYHRCSFSSLWRPYSSKPIGLGSGRALKTPCICRAHFYVLIVHLHVCLLACPSEWLAVCLCLCLSVTACLVLSLTVRLCLSCPLSDCLFVRKSVCLSACLPKQPVYCRPGRRATGPDKQTACFLSETSLQCRNAILLSQGTS